MCTLKLLQLRAHSSPFTRLTKSTSCNFAIKTCKPRLLGFYYPSSHFHSAHAETPAWKKIHSRETPDGIKIFLDDKPLKFNPNQTLSLPLSKSSLALAIVDELKCIKTFRDIAKVNKTPLLALTSRALDILHADRAKYSLVRNDILQRILKFFSTDTLMCWNPQEHSSADQPSLRQIQENAARPVLHYLTSKLWPNITILPTLNQNSIYPIPQCQESIETVSKWCNSLNPFDLAGLEHSMLISKSFLIAARFVAEWSSSLTIPKVPGDSVFTSSDAFNISNLELHWQTSKWGNLKDVHEVDRHNILKQFDTVICLIR